VPGEIGQFDWWDVPIEIPVGKNRSRRPYGLVATLPHSAAHETVFTFSKTMGDFCPAFLGVIERFGGVPQAGCSTTTPRSWPRARAKMQCSITRWRTCSVTCA
jgi:hypothetical protein